MSWALPFLLMQLFAKARSTTEFIDVTQGSFLLLSGIGVALFCLFVGVVLGRFPLVHSKEGRMRELKERFLHGLSRMPG